MKKTKCCPHVREKRPFCFLLRALVAREVRQGVVGDGELQQSKDNDLMEANQGRLARPRS